MERPGPGSIGITLQTSSTAHLSRAHSLEQFFQQTKGCDINNLETVPPGTYVRQWEAAVTPVLKAGAGRVENSRSIFGIMPPVKNNTI